MTEFFLRIVNMSISASWLIFVVLILRIFLKKAPKWIHVSLWGIVGLKLINPFSIKSVMSLIPSAETISPEIMTERMPAIETGFASANNVVNPIISESFAPTIGDSVNPLQVWIPLFSVLWCIGLFVLLIYTIITYCRLKVKVRTAVLLRKNIFQSENINSPFVLGFFQPKIYIPFAVSATNLKYVVAHERAHIKRHDHWWKPLGFLLLAVHWFNPLVWLSYTLLCRDIELACDEKVIKNKDNEQRADYSQALLSCSINQHKIAACPLAFGEVGVKERVESIMKYKKPALWILIFAGIVCAAVGVCFLTDPIERSDKQNLSIRNNESTSLFAINADTAANHVPVTPISTPASFSSTQDEIVYKMLNSMDYFSTAKVSFSALFPGFDIEQNYYIETNIDTGIAHQICSDNYIQQHGTDTVKAYETYSDGEVVREYNNLTQTFHTVSGTQERRALTEEWPGIEDRYYVDENGEPHYRYRGNPTNADMAGECLLPQVSAFAYLMTQDLWSVVGTINYCDRECYSVTGTVNESYSAQIGADTFMMYVDQKTGILLKLEAYNENGNIVSSMTVSEITIDSPEICSTFNYDMSKYREYDVQE